MLCSAVFCVVDPLNAPLTIFFAISAGDSPHALHIAIHCNFHPQALCCVQQALLYALRAIGLWKYTPIRLHLESNTPRFKPVVGVSEAKLAEEGPLKLSARRKLLLNYYNCI